MPDYRFDGDSPRVFPGLGVTLEPGQVVTTTEERVAADSPGDQRATMESTVKLRKDLS